jgi:hypothetical protein
MRYNAEYEKLSERLNSMTLKYKNCKSDHKSSLEQLKIAKVQHFLCINQKTKF